MGVRNYLDNEYKDPMTTTRKDGKDAKPYSYKGWKDPTGPNPWVKWEARVFEGDGANNKVV